MDKLIRAVDRAGRFRVLIANTTATVEEMRRLHDTSTTATAALGRLITMAVILGSDLKNKSESITIKVDGKGPSGIMTAVAAADGTVKGYLDHPHVDVASRPDGKLDVGKFVGKDGVLSITRDYELKEPYVGFSPLVSGEIADDFANYFYYSEQQPTVVSLGVYVDTDYSCTAAGGIFLQTLPGIDEETLGKLEELSYSLPSATEIIRGTSDPVEILKRYFDEYDFEILDEKEISYRCDCSVERIEKVLGSLAAEELESMIEEDHGAEVHCHFCNKTYKFEEQDLKSILERREPLDR